MGVEQTRAGRAGRAAKGLGDLGRRVPEEVVEHEDRPLIGREPAEPAFEQVPIDHGNELVRRRRSVDRQDPEVLGAATLSRRLRDADMDQEAGQPGIEPVRIAEPSEVTPGDHQRVLEGILGPVDVTEDPLGDREQAVAPPADEVDERRLVSTLGGRQKVPIHPVPLAAPFGGAVRLYWWIGGHERSFFGGLALRHEHFGVDAIASK